MREGELSPSATELSPSPTTLALQARRRVPQQQIRLGLGAASVTLQPCNHILVQSNGDRPFFGPIKSPNLRPTPIQHLWHFRQINIGVFFSCQRRDVSSPFFAEPLHDSSSPASPKTRDLRYSPPSAFGLITISHARQWD